MNVAFHQQAFLEVESDIAVLECKIAELQSVRDYHRRKAGQPLDIGGSSDVFAAKIRSDPRMGHRSNLAESPECDAADDDAGAELDVPFDLAP